VGYGVAGAINTRERVEGREIRTVAIDPERAPLVRMAFDLYATGDYSISELRDRLDEAGLRSRQTAKCAPAALSRSQVHRMLHDAKMMPRAGLEPAPPD
jgi:site-specific DNA recombinase